jgi:ABC-type proline/glycine betaine transport system ATPase subunit
MIEFRGIRHGVIRDLTAIAPDGALVGIVGLHGSGKAALLRLAAGVERPERGEVIAPADRRLLLLGETPDFSPVRLLAMDAALACQDPVVKARAALELSSLQRRGTTILISSYDEPFLLAHADELWWMREGEIAMRGDPRTVLPEWRAFCAEQFEGRGKGELRTVDARERRGDHRATIDSLATLDGRLQPTSVWRSGEHAAVRVVVRFAEAVERPVLGMMIRTRVGSDVYGTNTELENVQIGPCAAGVLLRVDFRMRCDLCPGDYTITAASHDRDGTPHDWLEDAVLVAVADSRYTAGVANLRATVEVSKA